MRSARFSNCLSNFCEVRTSERCSNSPRGDGRLTTSCKSCPDLLLCVLHDESHSYTDTVTQTLCDVRADLTTTLSNMF